MKEIPKQFRDPNYKFRLCYKNSKAWVKSLISQDFNFDDKKLINHINHYNGNVAILGEFGCLNAIDIDDPNYFRIFDNLFPYTYIEKTKRGYHFFIISLLNEYIDLFDPICKNKKIGEFRGGSKHTTMINPSIVLGNEYKPINDFNLSSINKDILLAKLDQFRKPTVPTQKKIIPKLNEKYFKDKFKLLLKGDSYLKKISFQVVKKGLRSEIEQRIILLLKSHQLRDNSMSYEFIDYFMNNIPMATKWKEATSSYRVRTYNKAIATKPRELNIPFRVGSVGLNNGGK